MWSSNRFLGSSQHVRVLFMWSSNTLDNDWIIKHNAKPLNNVATVDIKIKIGHNWNSEHPNKLTKYCTCSKKPSSLTCSLLMAGINIWTKFPSVVMHPHTEFIPLCTKMSTTRDNYVFLTLVTVNDCLECKHLLGGRAIGRYLVSGWHMLKYVSTCHFFDFGQTPRNNYQLIIMKMESRWKHHLLIIRIGP